MDKYSETQIILQDEKTIYKNVTFSHLGVNAFSAEGFPAVLYDTPCNRVMTFNLHWHDGYEITFPLSGTLNFLINGKSYRILPGEVLFIDASIVHGPASIVNDNCHYASIHVGKEFLCPIRSGHIYQRYFSALFSGDLDFTCHLTFEMPITKKVAMLLQGIYNNFRRLPQNALAIQADILMIFSLAVDADIFSPATNNNTFLSPIKDAINYIISSFSTSISVKELASSQNMSEAQFGRLFKKSTGMTPKDYILKTRISNAIEKMQLYPDKKINEIAYDSGFTDANYFARIFKEKIGHTPLEYKNLLSVQNASPNQ